MPLYEYVCTQCQHNFQKLVRSKDTVECPECKAEEVEKELSLPGMPIVSSKSSGCDTSLPPCSPSCCRLPK